MTLSEFLLRQKIQNMIPEPITRTRLRMGTSMMITRVSVDRPAVTEARINHYQVTECRHKCTSAGRGCSCLTSIS